MTRVDQSQPDIASAFTSISDTYDGIGLTDPYPLYAELRSTTPVMEGDILARFGVPSQADYANKGRKVFTVFRNEDVFNILRDSETWTTDLLLDGFGDFLDGVMISTLGGDAHRRLRGLIQPGFAPAVLARWNNKLITPLFREELVPALRHRGRADLVRDFALPFPVRAIYAVLGFPDDHELMERFAGWALRVLAGPQKDPERARITIEDAFRASQELYDNVLPIVADNRAAGAVGDGLISHLLRSSFEGQALNDHQITNLVRMMLPPATETTTRTFANLMVLLFDNPETLERVRQDRSLIRKALQESMRCEPVAGFLARQASRDVVLSGVTIPEGAAVSLCSGAASRDPDVYDHPDRFDIDRPTRPHLGFGFGMHMCLGLPVAQMEIEAAVDAMLDLPNLRLDPDRPRPQIRGLQMRGPDAVHVIWDA